MKKDEREQFISCVDKNICDLAAQFSLLRKDPKIESYGVFITYKGLYCSVQFYYGPPEFEVLLWLINESFPNTGKEYGLTDLYSVHELKEWIINNKLSLQEDDLLCAQVAWYIKFIKECCMNAFQNNSSFFNQFA